MAWNLEEAIGYYKKQGAPSDQSSLICLMKEVQCEHGGAVPAHLLPAIAQGLGTTENLLLALIRRIPSLRLGNTHCLELCAGPNCGKHTALAAFAEETFLGTNVTIKFIPCMRLCGKGPNLRFDGKLYHHADKALLLRLKEDCKN